MCNTLLKLNTCFFVVFVHSHLIEDPLINLEATHPHFLSGSVIVGAKARLGLNTCLKHLKITTTLMV
jgi:hypothetical protein